jgi:hypothetical protein
MSAASVKKTLQKIEEAHGDLDDYYGVFSMGKVGIEKYYEKTLARHSLAHRMLKPMCADAFCARWIAKIRCAAKRLTLYLDVQMQQAAVDCTGRTARRSGSHRTGDRRCGHSREQSRRLIPIYLSRASAARSTAHCATHPTFHCSTA